jgi:hypothetical protein
LRAESSLFFAIAGCSPIAISSCLSQLDIRCPPDHFGAEGEIEVGANSMRFWIRMAMLDEEKTPAGDAEVLRYLNRQGSQGAL